MIDVIKFGLLKSRQAILGLRTQQVINMMWTAYSTKTKPNLPESTPVQTSWWKKLFGPIRSWLSYHETRAEPSSISISLCFRPMKEQGNWCRRKLRELYTFRTNLVDNLLCPCPLKAGGCAGWPNSMTSFYGKIFVLVKWISFWEDSAIFLCGFIRIRWVGWRLP